MNNKKILRAESLLLISMFVLNILILVFRLYRGDFEFQDFHARWQECAYFIRRINPFTAMNGVNVIASIGEIDSDMVTVPWAWIWSLPINPGFVSFAAARVYGIVLYIVIPCVTAYEVYTYTLHTIGLNKIWSVLSAITIFVQYSLVWSFLCGNHGALACYMIIIAIMIYKKHPYIAAIVLTVAMIKPQVTALFVFCFLLLREYKIVITIVASELVSVIIIYLMLGENIFTLLSSAAGVGTNLNGVYFGIFNLLKYIGIPSTFILLMDMLVGILFTFISSLVINKANSQNNSYAEMDLFFVASVASTFWFYKQSHDFVILALPCIILLWKVAKDESPKVYMTMVMQGLFLAIFYGQSVLRKILVTILPFVGEATSKELCTMVSCIILLFATIIYIYVNYGRKSIGSVNESIS